jgi:hypothetical protein
LAKNLYSIAKIVKNLLKTINNSLGMWQNIFKQNLTCRVLAAATREMCMRSSAKRNVVHDATCSSSTVAGAWIAPRLPCLLAFCNYQSCPGAWPRISSSPHMRRHDHCPMHTSRSSVLKSFFFSPLLVSSQENLINPHNTSCSL